MEKLFDFKTDGGEPKGNPDQEKAYEQLCGRGKRTDDQVDAASFAFLTLVSRPNGWNWLCRIGLHYWSKWKEQEGLAFKPFAILAIETKSQRRECCKCGRIQRAPL